MPSPNKIQEYWLQHRIVNKYPGIRETFVMCPRLVCKDGFNMSVQASSGHYCTPRDYLKDGSYSAWEIGFPSESEDLILEWVEDPETPTQTVYAYVPTDIINQVIEKHGGLV